MKKRLAVRLGILVGLVAFGMNVAQAQGDFCALSAFQMPQNPAESAAQLACQEHQLWREPFINADGQLLKIGPMEAERDTLADGSPAWRRVLRYWQNSVGVNDLFRGQQPPQYADAALNDALTRTQIVDTPWSGAFISYLMRTAGLTEAQFHFADGHIRYIKQAYAAELAPAAEPNPYAFRLHDPTITPLQVGDLLCYVRESRRVFGAVGFRLWLREHYHDELSLKSHCDIVVGKNKNHAYTIGGNVVQAVTMRELRLNARGALSAQYAVPVRSGSWLVEVLSEDDTPSCRLDALKQCNMNRQDWVALLRYQP